MTPLPRDRRAPGLAGWTAGIVGYFALVFTLKALLFSGATPDEGEQLLQAQALHLGYHLENPPFFTWLTVALGWLTGPSLGAVSGLRLAALCLYYVGLLQAARYVLRDRALIVLAALSPVLLWFVGWDALRNYTHSLFMIAALAWLFVTLLAWRVSRRRSRDLPYALAVGAICGLGALSKYLFLLPASTLIAAGAIADRRLKERLLSRHGAIAALVACALVLPHAIWLLTHAHEFTASIGGVLHGGAPPSAQPHGLVGLEAFATSGLGFALPLLPLFALLLGRSVLVGGSSPPPVRPDVKRWLDWHMALMSLALLVGAIALHTVGVRQHHFFTFALLPLWLFAQLRGRVAPWRLQAWRALLAIAAAASAVALPLRAYTEAQGCRKCYDVMPYRNYAAQIVNAGFRSGPILSYSSDFSEPGENLRRFLPASRVFSTKHPELAFALATAAGEQCLVVWDASREPARAEALMREPPPLMAVPLPAGSRRGVLTAPLANSERPAPALGYALLARGEGGCPRYVGAGR